MKMDLVLVSQITPNYFIIFVKCNLFNKMNFSLIQTNTMYLE